MVELKALDVTGVSNASHNLYKPFNPFPLSIPPCIRREFISDVSLSSVFKKGLVC